MDEPPPRPWRVPHALPLGEARLTRPASIVPLSFEDLLYRRRTLRAALEIVPVEAAQPGDTQVLAAREPAKYHSPVTDLDGLGRHSFGTLGCVQHHSSGPKGTTAAS